MGRVGRLGSLAALTHGHTGDTRLVEDQRYEPIPAFVLNFRAELLPVGTYEQTSQQM